MTDAINNAATGTATPNTGAPAAAPTPQFGSGGTTPAVNPAATANAVNMANGGQPAIPDAGTDWSQIIAVGLISLTFISLIFQIIVNKKQHELLGKEDKKSDKDISELRYNLKKAMGDKYESMA